MIKYLFKKLFGGSKIGKVDGNSIKSKDEKVKEKLEELGYT